MTVARSAVHKKKIPAAGRTTMASISVFVLFLFGRLKVMSSILSHFSSLSSLLAARAGVVDPQIWRRFTAADHRRDDSLYGRARRSPLHLSAQLVAEIPSGARLRFGSLLLPRLVRSAAHQLRRPAGHRYEMGQRHRSVDLCRQQQRQRAASTSFKVASSKALLNVPNQKP